MQKKKLEEQPQKQQQQKRGYPEWMARYALYGGAACLGLALIMLRPLLRSGRIIRHGIMRIVGAGSFLFVSSIFWKAWRAKKPIQGARRLIK